MWHVIDGPFEPNELCQFGFSCDTSSVSSMFWAFYDLGGDSGCSGGWDLECGSNLASHQASGVFRLAARAGATTTRGLQFPQ